MSDFFKIGDVLVEVTLAILPLVFIFLIFQIFFLKLPHKYVANLGRGILLTFIGLVLFLHGVKFGFLPAGTAMGEAMGTMEHKWILIPVGFCLGFVATIAEPAVRVLSTEIEKASTGAIKAKLIIYTLSLGVALFVALGMLRIISGISLYYLVIPGYLAALGMLKFTDQTFISIAFDSGAVATGPMTVTFIMALSVGTAMAIENRNPVIDGLGLIALVALAPIISIMILGIFYSKKRGK